MTDPATGRLTVQTVKRLHRILQVDNEMEGIILDFILAKWQAPTLLHIPEKVARGIIERPFDFCKAARAWKEMNPF